MHDFSSLIYRIYQAALLPEQWPDALLDVARFFDAECALVMFANPNSPVEMITSPGVEHIYKVYFEEEWWKKDIRVHRGPKLLHDRGIDVYTDNRVATPYELEHHPIYADFIPRTGLGWCMVSSILPDLDMPVLLAIHRDKAKGPFIDQGEMDALVPVSRHIEQAMRVSLRLSYLESSQSMLQTAWDSVEMCIFGLNEDGRVILRNRLAELHFDKFFHLVDGRMQPRNKATPAPQRAARPSQLQTESRLPEAQIVIGDDGSKMALWSIPIGAAARPRIGLSEDATALTIAVPLENGGHVAPTVIRDLFGLTLGEARLASLIGGGSAINEAADRLGIAEGTARVVLKRVFRKLGVSRQAELVSQIAKLGGVSAAITR